MGPEIIRVRGLLNFESIICRLHAEKNANNKHTGRLLPRVFAADAAGVELPGSSLNVSLQGDRKVDLRANQFIEDFGTDTYITASMIDSILTAIDGGSPVSLELRKITMKAYDFEYLEDEYPEYKHLYFVGYACEIKRKRK